VFGDVAASVAHIPAERRGVLAALDAAQVAERKAALAEKLRRSS
jgi:hypothetical protein